MKYDYANANLVFPIATTNAYLGSTLSNVVLKKYHPHLKSLIFVHLHK
jgi:hypothetical protein